MVYLDEQLRTIAGWNKDDLQLHAIEDNNRLVKNQYYVFMLFGSDRSSENADISKESLSTHTIIA